MGNQKIIFCSCDAEQIKSVFTRHANVAWTYFGKNINELSMLSRFDKQNSKVDTTNMLQNSAKDLRCSFVEFIGELSVINNSICWWGNRISEKNPFVSDLFLYICYLDVYKKLLRNDSLIVFLNDPILLKTLVKNTPRSARVKKLGFVKQTVKRWGAIIKTLFLNKTYFLISNFYRILLARTNKTIVKHNITLIYTWLNNNSFSQGNYREAYLGELPMLLKKNNKNYAILPAVLRKVSYKKIVKELHSRDDFLLLESTLGVFDLIKASFKSMWYTPKITKINMCNLNISDLIKQECVNERIDKRRETDLLLYYFLKHLKKKNISIASFVYPFENHTWEKIMLLGLKELYPRTKTIGYQHAVVPLNLTNYFFSKKESSIIPLPKKIITSGKYFKMLFSSENYNSEILKVGGAIRYSYLFKNKQAPKRASKRTILVTPAIEKTEATELIWKTLHAFRDKANYKIIFKFHPYFNIKDADYLIKQFPDNFSIANSPISELLNDASLLIYTSSTTAIEALFQKIPVLHVKSNFLVDKDPLDFNPKLRRSAKNSEEIFEFAKRSLAEGYNKSKITDLFKPVTDKTYSLFM